MHGEIHSSIERCSAFEMGIILLKTFKKININSADTSLMAHSLGHELDPWGFSLPDVNQMFCTILYVHLSSTPTCTTSRTRWYLSSPCPHHLIIVRLWHSFQPYLFHCHCTHQSPVSQLALCFALF